MFSKLSRDDYISINHTLTNIIGQTRWTRKSGHSKLLFPNDQKAAAKANSKDIHGKTLLTPNRGPPPTKTVLFC